MIDDGQSLPILDDLNDAVRTQSFLQKLGFHDWELARDILRRLEFKNLPGFSAIFPFLITALGSAANPDRSLMNFERFMDAYGSGFFSEFEKNPRVIEILITLFSNSPFLTEILLRSPKAIELLHNRERLTERKTIEQFHTEAISTIRPNKADLDKLDMLRRYQRSQFLRIGINDFQGLFDLQTVSLQLSRLAIGMVRACLDVAYHQTRTKPEGFVVFALGKLGGRELNYSSDIDLVFAAKRNSDDTIQLSKQLIYNIAATTTEGFLYRVDVRLRPWGYDGPLVSSLDGYIQYMHKHARLWEKQAFFKARAIAGNISFGEELRKEIEPFLFRASAEEVRAGIFSMKQRTEELLQEKGRSWGEVKLGEGSIRDVEFVVQYLQMTHPTIRTRATMKAMPQLREAGLLTSSEMHTLMDGYNFLRTTEHYLQMIDYRQASTLPSDSVSITLLARRLGFEGLQAGEQFIERYERHCRAIRSIFLKIVGNETIKELANLPGASPQMFQHVARMDASYTATFSPEEIQQHALLIDKIRGDSIVIVDAKPLDNTRWRVTVVGYDYLGELSLICGLMFIYGLDIIEGQIFTYEPLEGNKPLTNELAISKPVNIHTSKSVTSGKAQRAKIPIQAGRSKIVDVFVVRSVHNDSLKPEIWIQYSEDLKALLLKIQTGQRREARGELAKKVGVLFQEMKSNITPLYPIDIEIDNESSEKYTVMKIGTTDTVGFLYELSNALSMNHVNIARMFVQSIGTQVNDTIYVTDDQGNKIISSEKQRELRTATVLIKHFTHLLPQSPNPESALLHFREFLGQLFERPNWPEELAQLDQPVVLDALAKLLGVSDFLWDDFLRMQYSNLFPVVRDVDALAANKERRQLEDELEAAVKSSNDWRAALNAFKDREMFRIDMRHILGYTPEFWEFSFGLTDLVEVVVSAVYGHCREEIEQEYGIPLLQDGHACPATIFALGKCGGRELGFASDIELMLIYGGIGNTTGRNNFSTSEYFEELVRSFVKSIQARKDGIFNIDLRLRPYGKAGSLAVSLEAYKRYFEPMGPAWEYERQALVKLRPIAGDQVLGGNVCELRDEFVYNGKSFNITAMRAMRERQIRHLVAAGIINAKYSPGGLVDLEYTVQALQITHGATHPSLRSTNTRLAMAALAKIWILSADDYTRLRKAHTFLRWLIDALRVVRGNAKDNNIPPYDSEEFAFLARRLRYGKDINQLREDLSRHMVDVAEINLRLLPNP